MSGLKPSSPSEGSEKWCTELPGSRFGWCLGMASRWRRCLKHGRKFKVHFRAGLEDENALHMTTRVLYRFLFRRKKTMNILRFAWGWFDCQRISWINITMKRMHQASLQTKDPLNESFKPHLEKTRPSETNLDTMEFCRRHLSSQWFKDV